MLKASEAREIAIPSFCLDHPTAYLASIQHEIVGAAERGCEYVVIYRDEMVQWMKDEANGCLGGDGERDWVIITD